ncbi:hypothetical protein [Oceanobacillus bengalensis]|uniref:Endolytic transglycosylase MltG n=1 Tax=Oceanobacillus bengalensis TaxID=1435466 RepID=A0A494Z5J7_9BACI|nr:hypothetical protein [Oceanobacillus bengalensis]RKQ17822.1 hypothetical protein D8M05_02730 [Oceanobacillus bengalensis]
MKQLLRYFSVGLFAAGIIMLIGLYFTDTRDVEEYTAKELIPYVENEGYHVIDNEEYISLTLNSNKVTEEDNQSKEADSTKTESPKEDKEEPAKDVKESANEEKDTRKENEEDKEKEKEEEVKVTNYTLTIESGMLTSTISSILEENKIIDNAREFTNYLDDNDYSLLVQLGDFKLNSDMSFYELAEAITN